MRAGHAAAGALASSPFSRSPVLAGPTLKDRLRLIVILASRAGRRARRATALPGRAASRIRARAPERLLIAPQDIRTADPTIAADIAAGYFAFGGRIVNASGRSPFVLEPADAQSAGAAAAAEWQRGLCGFGWLRHLRAADQPAAGARGRALVAAFLDVHAKPSQATAWEPRVAARRVLAWLSQSPVLLAGADRAFYTRFMQSLATHRAALAQRLSGGLTGESRLVVALALAEYGLCAADSVGWLRAGTAALAAEIDTQILPDGGHISRNPQILIDLLIDMLPLRHAYAARGIQAPQQLLNAIDRMMPMLRLFRHGDGALALFNGMGVTAPELVATILAYDDARAQPVTNARYAGYQRLEAAGTIVVVEAGAVPPQAFSMQAHAGCLAFELSSGIRRIIVNCGAPEVARANAREAARTTAAHSTLVVDDTSSCRFAASAGLGRWLRDEILSGPSVVTAERGEDEAGAHVFLSHDGYAQRFGLVHHRELVLARDGSRLEGRDRLEAVGKRASGPTPYALRFHLHPSVKAHANDEGTAVRLDAPDGESWLIEADAPMVVEPSILFAASGGPRATLQVKLAADTGGKPEVRWHLQRIATGEPRRR